WQRDRTPLLFYGETLIAAVGVFVTREGKPDEDVYGQVSWIKQT
ncbi:TilS substrate C-terminal domain-containing protein, partial [Erwinia billingiae]